MALINRLAGIPEAGQSPDQVGKLGFVQVLAILHEIKRGNITPAGAASALGLDAGETTELTWLYNKVKDLNASQRATALKEMTEVLHCAEMGIDDSANGGLDYTDAAVVQARITSI